MALDFNSIALAGGGGIGAYQVGVMKALAENSKLDQVRCLSGTSVGALNAVLYSIGDVELAEYIWMTWVDPLGMIGKIEYSSMGIHFSRETLRELLRKADITRIKHSIPVYACAHDIKNKRRRYFYLNNKNESEMIEILLASSAIPVIYSPVKIGDSIYMDGNSSPESPLDNYPVEVLYKKGSRHILLVPLRYDFDGHNVRTWIGKPPQDIYKTFSEADISVLNPSCNIGGFINIVDFRKESILTRIALGFRDGCDFLKETDETSVPKGEPYNVIRFLAKRYIHTTEDMESFIALRKNKLLTAENPTLGGHIWYEDIFEIGGIRIQWHNKVPVVGKIFENHYRILGKNDELRAYYFDPDDLIEDLVLFGKSR